ncbi:MAG TPA: amino acid ABC transporter substrate-binding protein [Streptosporangiaceae bacterium]
MSLSKTAPGQGRRYWRSIPLLAVMSLSTLVAAACGAASGAGSAGGARSPVVIGVSVPLSGDFSQDGPATEQGYKTWAAYQNAHGGLLGRPIQLDFLSDGSSPVQVVTNYQKLIASDHVNFVLGPFSTFLTGPAAVIANRYGYAMIEGSGDAPVLFQQGLHNLFGVSAPAETQLNTLAKWIPTAFPPQSVAYATGDDPLVKPEVDGARAYLQSHGFRTAVYKVYPAETTDYSPITSAIVSSGAKIVVLGSGAPDGETFIQQMIQDKFNPLLLVEAAGPDAGASFVKAIGAANDEGIMVPNTWYPGAPYPGNQQMISEYMKLFGAAVQNNPQNVSADTAEAFAAGQVLAEAVNHTGSLSNSKLEAYLHSGATFSTVQGTVQFQADGENGAARPFIFQWQHQKLVPVLPQGLPGIQPIEKSKPAWGQSPAK